MSTLLFFVIVYIAGSILIGIIAALRVHSTEDFVLAGRSLPLYIVTVTVFATWFGSETVLGVSSTFIAEGLRGIVSDPFGASLCLIFVGIFFAAKLYRLGLLTIGDYYRVRYDALTEILVSSAIVISYFGWLSAQFVVIGIVFNIVTEGAINMHAGIVIGASVVVIYTLWGGMFAVAWTNFAQMLVILVGLIYILFILANQAGGISTVVAHAYTVGHFEFWPQWEARDIFWFIGALVTVMLGSIPQQDVFQRVMSARTEEIAIKGAILGGLFYFMFTFVPIFLAYSAFLIDPKMVSDLMEVDHQQILPTLILNHTPLFAQILFFGALLSAVMSTASGTLLAPSVTFTQNILGKLIRYKLSNHQLLKVMRSAVIAFAIVVTIFSLYTDATIYQLVVGASKVTLVTAFIPLVAGLYWVRATRQGALLSILLGLVTWVASEAFDPEGFMPPQLTGLIMSMLGMVAGSLLPQWYGRKPHVESVFAAKGEHLHNNKQ